MGQEQEVLRPDSSDGRGTRRRRFAVWGGAVALWLLPWVAMRFDTGVDWSVGDFVIFGLLLIATCIGLELAVGMSRSRRTRMLASILVVLGFLWLWAELAVGLFTDWGS